MKKFKTLFGVIAAVLIYDVMIFTMLTTSALGYVAGEERTYSGRLAVNADSKYDYTLEGKKINLITKNKQYFDTLIGKEVNVKVRFTGEGQKFRILSITPATGTASTPSKTPSTSTTGSTVGFLKEAPADSGYDYYVKDTNSLEGKTLARVIVSDRNKPTWDKFVDQKVKMSYKYVIKNGVLNFWNATLELAK
jgi:hypothetical protein